MGRAKALSVEQNVRLRDLAKSVAAQRRLSQAKLAVELKVEPGSLSLFLSGKNGASTELARRIATVAGIDPGEFAMFNGTAPTHGPVDTAQASRAAIAEHFMKAGGAPQAVIDDIVAHIRRSP